MAATSDTIKAPMSKSSLLIGPPGRPPTGILEWDGLFVSVEMIEER